MNEHYANPSLPDGVAAQVLKGLYRIAPARSAAGVRLLGSGAILREVLSAAELLRSASAMSRAAWRAPCRWWRRRRTTFARGLR